MRDPHAPNLTRSNSHILEFWRDGYATPLSETQIRFSLFEGIPWLTLEGEQLLKWGLQPLNHNKQTCNMFPNDNHDTALLWLFKAKTKRTTVAHFGGFGFPQKRRATDVCITGLASSRSWRHLSHSPPGSKSGFLFPTDCLGRSFQSLRL